MESVVQENTSLKAEIARLQSIISSKDTTIAAKDASIATKDADGLDLALQIRFKTHELADMTKTIAKQRALLASQDEDNDMLKTFLESASYEYAELEESYNLLRAARVHADRERIAELETSVEDWRDMFFKERGKYDDLLKNVQVKPRE